MTILRNGFEGSNGTSLTAGSGGNTVDGGDYFDTVNFSGAAPDNVTFSTTQKHNGSTSGKFDSTNTGLEYVEWTTQWPTTSSTCYGRAYVYPVSQGSTNKFFKFIDSSSNEIACMSMSASGRFQIHDLTTFQQGAVQGTGAWYRVEFEVPIGNSVTITAKIFKGANLDGITADETITMAGADTQAIPADNDRIRIGNNTNGTIWYFDDVGASDVNWLGPTMSVASWLSED